MPAVRYSDWSEGRSPERKAEYRGSDSYSNYLHTLLDKAYFGRNVARRFGAAVPPYHYAEALPDGVSDG